MKKGQKHKHPSQAAHRPSPPSQPIPENRTPHTDPTARQREAEKRAGNPDFDKYVLRWTRVVGIFTAILAVVGIIQAWAFIQSERAFIGFLGIISPFELVPEIPITAQAKIKNAGRSTAFVIDANVTTTITLDPLPKNPSYERDNSAAIEVAGPLTAGQEQIVTLRPRLPDGTRAALDARLAQAIESGSEKMYFFGYVEYTDDFSLIGARTTGFCVRYVPKTKDRTAEFDLCGNRNYAYAH